MRSNTPCPVPGCLTAFVFIGYGYQDHIKQTHVRCKCGWVGVSYNGHRAQRLRRGYDMTRHQLVGTV